MRQDRPRSSPQSPPTIKPDKPTGKDFNMAGNALSWPIKLGSALGKAL